MIVEDFLNAFENQIAFSGFADEGVEWIELKLEEIKNAKGFQELIKGEFKRTPFGSEEEAKERIQRGMLPYLRYLSQSFKTLDQEQRKICYGYFMQAEKTTAWPIENCSMLANRMKSCGIGQEEFLAEAVQFIGNLTPSSQVEEAVSHPLHKLFGAIWDEVMQRGDLNTTNAHDLEIKRALAHWATEELFAQDNGRDKFQKWMEKIYVDLYRENNSNVGLIDRMFSSLLNLKELRKILSEVILLNLSLGLPSDLMGRLDTYFNEEKLRPFFLALDELRPQSSINLYIENLKEGDEVVDLAKVLGHPLHQRLVIATNAMALMTFIL